MRYLGGGELSLLFNTLSPSSSSFSPTACWILGNWWKRWTISYLIVNLWWTFKLWLRGAHVKPYERQVLWCGKCILWLSFSSLPIFGNILDILHWVSPRIKGTFWVRYVQIISSYPGLQSVVLRKSHSIHLCYFSDLSTQMPSLSVHKFSPIVFSCLRFNPLELCLSIYLTRG